MRNVKALPLIAVSLTVLLALLSYQPLAAAAAPLLALTETPTLTATATSLPTDTPTATATGLPTNTPTTTATGLPSSTPTATPTNAPGSSPTPGSQPTSTAAPIVLDPLITKAVNLEQAHAGDIVEFTIFITNPNSVEVPNVVVVDPLPSLVVFMSAATPQGDFTFDANTNTLTFNLGTLAPGQVVVITITTRVSDQAQPPDQFRNLAIVSDSDSSSSSNTTTTTLVPGSLPAAGLGPGRIQYAMLLGLGLGLLLLAVMGWWLALRRRL